ncbi:hypothetical protein JVT61DRAFT_3911 [Boletus reticuloceps]|uniref:Integrase core domain-containing protein n=1 Tax=Boletus reticuloceps TaxID=495285 RepID=A0A8I2YMK4_9AGAM|nr:hypothetical protein JVT61DRAFT_3911 [Boletus reticuloceps]
MGLKCTCQQAHTPQTIREVMVEMRQVYPNAGVREMISLLFHEKGMAVSRNIMREYFALYEPELIHQRKARCLLRHRFWAAGVNDIWAVDQHDKWKRFDLALHTGVEPFSGKILWMKVWHSNQNPQLILTYYLEAVKKLGFAPLVTQSDPGTENFGIANAHTVLRQWHDEALSILERGIASDWFDPDNFLHIAVFCWLFIPWLQAELEAYCDRINHTTKHHDRKKALPHGIPELVFTSPEDFGALDFKVVTIDPIALDHVQELYMNPSHPVFDLVPESIDIVLDDIYAMLGRPAITWLSIWDVYLDLLHQIQDSLSQSDNPLQLSLDDDALPLLENQADLPFQEDADGYYYMGGVGRGLGMHGADLQRLDEMDADDEAAIQLIEVGSDAVVARFSDEDNDDIDDD